jgi:hypothetical protein
MTIRSSSPWEPFREDYQEARTLNVDTASEVKKKRVMDELKERQSG